MTRNSKAYKSLSAAEKDVAFLTCRGFRMTKIARIMGRSRCTVKNQLTSIYDKIGAGSQIELLIMLHGVFPCETCSSASWSMSET